jgi:hypothetical protein
MKTNSRRLFYINLNDWVWWAWALTTALLIAGLFGYDHALTGAAVVTAVHGLIVLVRDRSAKAYSVQLRVANLLLLLICYLPYTRWLYWLMVVGTLALSVFGYCFLTRVLSLCPWNSREAYTLERLYRTFFYAPDLGRLSTNPKLASCAGGLCTIEAQVATPKPSSQSHRNLDDTALNSARKPGLSRA